jgi:hypothetical protein
MESRNSCHDTGYVLNNKLSKSATSPPRSSTFFNFLDLPKEIRINIYKKALHLERRRTFFIFRDVGSRVECFAPGQPKPRLDLLHVNRQIHDEAGALLYGSSVFNVVDSMERQLRLLNAFLDCIGPANAAMLTFLCISFPADKEGGCASGEVILREDDVFMLKLLEERCDKLATLELFVHSNSSGVLTSSKGHEPGYRSRVLVQINGFLKRIFSLHTIIIRLYSGVIEPTASEVVTGFGWVVLHGDEQVK